MHGIIVIDHGLESRYLHHVSTSYWSTDFRMIKGLCNKYAKPNSDEWVFANQHSSITDNIPCIGMTKPNISLLIGLDLE